MEANQSRRGLLRAALALPAVAAVPAIAKAAPSLGDGKAIVRIGDETVLIDLTDFKVNEGERAVVIGDEGRMKIAVCRPLYEPQHWQPRGALGPKEEADKWGKGSYTRENLTVVGKVIEREPRAFLPA